MSEDQIKSQTANDPSLWNRVRDRIEEIESRMGLLVAEIHEDHSEEVQRRIARLKERFNEVMIELDQYDDSLELVRRTKNEFESLVKSNRFMRDHHDSTR